MTELNIMIINLDINIFKVEKKLKHTAINDEIV